MDDNDIQAWRQADQLFDHLLDLPPEQQQQALASASVASVVRERVLRLLAMSGQAPPWLERIESHPRPSTLSGNDPDSLSAMASAGAVDGAPDGAPDGALIGRQIGRWQIVSELGRGGMAVVFQARRTDGAVDQQAALKLLTVGTLGASGAEQFRRETDILARLQHPHIVGLLDAGVCDDGTPWLAMPLVQGQRIDHWCREQAADTRQVVGLFLQVCDAVACAHRSLVIHRDLKPSNILVDGDGQARLLDFGIARLADQPGGTGTHWLALTPDFAAPEQFLGAAPSTAMDIYGLGALLHCLLTGRAPKARPGAKTGAAAGADTLTRPSLAVADDAALAGRHQRALRDDLDRVVLKALAHEADRRYATVGELAADLRNWLSGRPVRATPPGRIYRLRKFISRHRIGVAASLALVLALVAGVAATLWQADQARNQAERALAARDLLVGILQAGDPTTQDGDDPPASELLRRGADKARQTLAEKPHLLAELLQVIGVSQINRAQFDDAAHSLDDALALHRAGAVKDVQQHATALYHRAILSYEQGQTDTAIEHARAALALAERHDLEPLRDRVQLRLADLLVYSRQLEEGTALAEDLVERFERRGEPPYPQDYVTALITLGRAGHYAGELDPAMVWMERAARHARALPDNPRMVAEIDNTLGVLYIAMQRYGQAREALSSALAIQTRLFGPDHPETLTTRSNLAGALMMAGQPAEAVVQFEPILRRHQELAAGQPHPDVAFLHGYLARARYLSGDSEAALADGEAAWAQMQGLTAEDQGGLESTGLMLGLLRMELSRPDPERLLADAPVDCTAIDMAGSLRGSVCLARALLAADAGNCQVPRAAQPVTSAEGLDGNERRWWAVYWLLHDQCPAAADDDTGLATPEHLDPVMLRTRLDSFSVDAQPPFPAWLQARIQALPALSGAGD
ncbi:MAG: serine/threonine-protein kinase [Xanthomonadales bacterium]|nr:serine/threonine-protein kinase [Xanthomonadales bacterium]